MQVADGTIRLSATDLANHLACDHLTQLDLAAARGEIKAPYRHDSRLEALQLRGVEHEHRYVEHLRARGRHVLRLESDGVQKTIDAMREGVDVIVQPVLAAGRWQGRADVLLKVQQPSRLGAWSYEVVDTKLSRETRAGTILQLCVYSEIVEGIQGEQPERMHVVVPGREFAPESYRTPEYFAYYRQVKRGLEHAVGAGGGKETYPEPVTHCDVCRWWSICDRRRREDDHISLVAGISKLQRRELQDRGVVTLEALAKLPLPLPWKPSRGSVEGFEKVREQARIQESGRRTGKPKYELLPLERERGLARLPAPSPGDIFFDFEGDPFVEPGGMEYLWGWVTHDSGVDTYAHRWSLTREEERSAFEGFVDMVMERWRRHPDLHIYHYAPYEPAALKRLMGRYASRETEIDSMLRAGVFVDLYGIVRQSLRAGVERYSIKDLEVFFDYKRVMPLRDASRALRAVEYGLELKDPASISREDLDEVRAYNADDCLATRHLRDWLERLRQERVDAGDAIARPRAAPGDASENVTAWLAKVGPVRDGLLVGLPADRADRNEVEQARYLLAHMLEFHRREIKAPWWEFFRLAELGPDELLDERDALAGLRFADRVGGKDRNPIHRYAFPFQETAIGEGDSLQVSADEGVGSVHAINPAEGWIDIKKRHDAREKHPSAVFSKTIYSTEELEESLLRIALWVAGNAIDADGVCRSGRDLLLRRAPRLLNGAPLRHAGESTLDAALRIAPLLDRTILCIQGPPGTGKTYTAARMAVDLVRRGNTVGVCAQSHKVIRNLLKAIVDAGKSRVTCVQKVGDSLGEDPGIREMKENKDVREALANGEARVAGGTAWMWAREDFADAVDVLFLDEAGQFPLANAVAISQGARSMVLVGDPQQLESPLQGAHPEGTEVSALHHVLGGNKTMPEELGLFIEETRRLAPRICRFTSEQFYEDRLKPFSGTELQEIRGRGAIDGAGLWFAPTSHEGNRNVSREEVRRVESIVNSLLRSGVTWRDVTGTTHPMVAADILIVAPYNAQAAELRRAMPAMQIGTVDKFQGQEAPVVIYSMATSSPEDAPRGMEFLYSLNRLNVATSRARCACVLVANPALFEPECRTPAQMRLANAFCRYLEVAALL